MKARANLSKASESNYIVTKICNYMYYVLHTLMIECLSYADFFKKT